MTKNSPTNRLNQLLPGSLAEVDSMLNHLFTGPVTSAVTRAAWTAPASLWEADNRLHVELDVPGVAQDAVEVTVENGQLAIVVERTPSAEPPTYLYNERRFGKVTRSLDLPDTVDPESVEAELKNGVLHVSIAKRPETQPRKIEVRVS
ncbi:Spore protein SP21 [Botrimarina colliarenosi]|uniref:Spore protein SP21 n=1 Tax=Botrimarina colliarenosi TaxID=2528001 RepID=A0A5C6A899_9BACT|nr:Hsp20/alpha crystallin family protein [Botrimarina colliarenosi]TWT95251.1 Spore protein SP21 [Botrimarina colliarenosi]